MHAVPRMQERDRSLTVTFSASEALVPRQIGAAASGLAAPQSAGSNLPECARPGKRSGC